MTEMFSVRMPKPLKDRFLEWLNKHYWNSMGKTSESFRRFVEVTLGLPQAATPQSENPFMEEYFTCPMAQKAAKVRDLPCIEPDFKCKNTLCQAALKERLKK